MSDKLDQLVNPIEVRVCIDEFNKEMDLIFNSEYHVEAVEDTSLGKYAQCIFFRFKNISKVGYSRLDFANANVISFIVFLTNNRGFVLDKFKLSYPSISWKYSELINTPVIESNSLVDLTENLIQWFRDNKESITSIKKIS